jgi:ribonuclease HI
MQKQGKRLNDLHPRGLYTAFVDGSVFDGGVHVGAGWVIECTDTGKIVESGSRRVSEASRGTSSIAEIYAAASALNAIAAGSVINLHSDDHDLCNVLQNRSLSERIIRNNPRPSLQQGYRDLFNAVSRHTAVNAIKTHVDDYPQMRMAHNLAREGAFARPQFGIDSPAP